MNTEAIKKEEKVPAFKKGSLVTIGNTRVMFVIGQLSETRALLFGLTMNSQHDHFKIVRYEEELRYLVLHDESEITPIGALKDLQECIVEGRDVSSVAEDI